MLRNGIIVAEDTPANLLNQFATDNLENAFLVLCKRQGEEHSVVSKSLNISELFEPRQKEEVHRRTLPEHETSKSKNLLRKIYVMKALTTKNFIQAFRRPA